MRSFLYSPDATAGGNVTVPQAPNAEGPTITLKDGTVITPDKIGSVRFKADDAVREMDGAGLFQQASKGYAANEILRQRKEWETERTTLQHSASQFQAQQELMQKYQETRDPEVAKQLLKIWGKEELIPMYDEQVQLAAQTTRAPKGGDELQQLQLSQLPSAVLEAVQFIAKLKQQGITDPAQEFQRLSSSARSDAVDRGRNFVNSQLDSSKKLGKLLGDGDTSRTIREDVWSKIQGRVARGEPLMDATAKVVRETETLYGAIEQKVISRFTGDPTLFGGAPSGTSGQPRLAPENEPNPDAPEYQEAGGTAKYFDDKIAYERMKQ